MDKLTVSQVAQELGCHPETVRRYERKGLLKGYRDYLNRRIFARDSVLELKKFRERLAIEKS